jgi:hypothetical protein
VKAKISNKAQEFPCFPTALSRRPRCGYANLIRAAAGKMSALNAGFEVLVLSEAIQERLHRFYEVWAEQGTSVSE